MISQKFAEKKRKLLLRKDQNYSELISIFEKNLEKGQLSEQDIEKYQHALERRDKRRRILQEEEDFKFATALQKEENDNNNNNNNNNNDNQIYNRVDVNINYNNNNNSVNNNNNNSSLNIYERKLIVLRPQNKLAQPQPGKEEEEEDDEDNDCAICCESLKRDLQKKLQCNHLFHNKCINIWFNKSRTCPICRRNC